VARSSSLKFLLAITGQNPNCLALAREFVPCKQQAEMFAAWTGNSYEQVF
jgi:hypothetical protein